MLDRSTRFAYYALACFGLPALTACSAGLASIAPVDLVPVGPEIVADWRVGFVPDRHRRYDLRWRFYTPKGSTAGRAAIRVAPPDSLRFDYRGPFGRSGAALVLGDSVIWAEPAKDVRQLIPLAPLFWAALGIPLAPATASITYGRDGARQRAWREVAGTDTLDVVHMRGVGERLTTQLRQGGITAATNVRFGPDGLPIQGEMRFPKDGAVFIFTVETVDTTVAFDAATWRHP